MIGLGSIIVVIIILLLVAVSSVVVQPPVYSQFERARRTKEGEEDATTEQIRADHLGDLQSLQRVVVSLLLVVSVVLLVAVFGWLIGIVLGVLLALEYGSLARLPYLRQVAQKQYDQFEPHLLKAIKDYPFIFGLLRSVTSTQRDIQFYSRQELLHMVDDSTGILTGDEKLLIKHGLEFPSRKVADIMTPRSVIESIKKGEILGPLVLDDLHKTGHSRFPVIDGDIDHVVGILHVRNLLTLDTTKRHTAKVETAMEPHVYYVHDSQSLDHALVAFLKTRHHMFIVVNEFRETVGLLTLEDTIEALLGRKIVDEFDAHDDLRSVAARHPKANDTAKQSTDV